MAITVEDVASTTYTLVSGDNGKLKRFTSASPVTITCPDTLTQGFECVLLQAGDGQLTCSKGGTSVFLNKQDIKSRAQNSVIAVTCSNNAEYKFNGELSISTTLIQSNYNASVDPAVTDDETKGYTKGSRWINSTSNKIFECLDPSTGVADWYQLTTGESTSLQDSPIASGTSHTVQVSDVGKRLRLTSAIGANFTFNVSASLTTSGRVCFRNESDYHLIGNLTSGTANGKNYFAIFKGEEITFEFNSTTDLRRVAGTTTEKVLVAIDEKAQGTDGGTIATANTWLQRDLNTIESDPHSLSVSLTGNNQRVMTGVYDVLSHHNFRGGNSIGSKAAVSIDSTRHIWFAGYSSQTSGVHYICAQVVKDKTILNTYDVKAELLASSTNTNTYARGYASNVTGIAEIYLKLIFIRKPD